MYTGRTPILFHIVLCISNKFYEKKQFSFSLLTTPSPFTIPHYIFQLRLVNITLPMSNLVDQILWAEQHSEKAAEIVEAANDFASLWMNFDAVGYG